MVRSKKLVCRLPVRGEANLDAIPNPKVNFLLELFSIVFVSGCLSPKYNLVKTLTGGEQLEELRKVINLGMHE